MSKKVKMVDTTLRDGEQTAGVVFANKEKLHIAKMLDAIGVDQIEAGVPVMGGDEKKAIKEIADAGLNASIMGWNRAVVADVQHSIDCGCDAVAISIAASDIHIQNKLKSTREKVLESISRACEFAKKHNLYVSVNAEDGSRAAPEYLLQFARTAKEAGADRLRFCDTIGLMEPFGTYEKIKQIIEEVGIEVEMHMHDDFGLATANTLAGIYAGATYAGVTVVGLGERAGNAALEEVVMALKYLYDTDLGYKTEKFRELALYVSRAAARELPIWKSIVGTNMFAHESGIHVDGALKDPRTYEPITPEEVGMERQIIVGKHSGTASIKHKFKEYGIELEDQEAAAILAEVRTLTVEVKRPLLDEELLSIYKELAK